MSPTSVPEFLRARVALFQYVSADHLEWILRDSHVASYEPNEAVVEFGEDATFLGVLLEGELTASIIGEGGQRQMLGRLTPGDTFGEMALMSGEKTLADLELLLAKYR